MSLLDTISTIATMASKLLPTAWLQRLGLQAVPGQVEDAMYHAAVHTSSGLEVVINAEQKVLSAVGAVRSHEQELVSFITALETVDPKLSQIVTEIESARAVLDEASNDLQSANTFLVNAKTSLDQVLVPAAGSAFIKWVLAQAAAFQSFLTTLSPHPATLPAASIATRAIAVHMATVDKQQAALQAQEAADAAKKDLADAQSSVMAQFTAEDAAPIPSQFGVDSNTNP